ncbi:hypothetical protein BC835DRAFT_1328463 [Cytidiella melzeri]|nr:hypothetical protein BC835DRAFT_1328463 [Cytidiella melzeri]
MHAPAFRRPEVGISLSADQDRMMRCERYVRKPGTAKESERIRDVGVHYTTANIGFPGLITPPCVDARSPGGLEVPRFVRRSRSRGRFGRLCISPMLANLDHPLRGMLTSPALRNCGEYCSPQLCSGVGQELDRANSGQLAQPASSSRSTRVPGLVPRSR